MTVDQAVKAALDALAASASAKTRRARGGASAAALTVADLVDQFIEGHAGKLKPNSREAYERALLKLKAADGSLKAEGLTARMSPPCTIAWRRPPTRRTGCWLRFQNSTHGPRAAAWFPRLMPTRGARSNVTGRSAGRGSSPPTSCAARRHARAGLNAGLPYDVDETKPTAKHAPKPERRLVKLDPFAVAAIRLLALTGARLREILDARWEQVDLERGVLFLSDSKTGKKPIYLSAAAQAVLIGLPRLAFNPHVIPGAKEGAPRIDLHKPWWAVIRAAGLDGRGSTT